MGVLKVNTGLQQVSHPARRLLDRAIAQRSFPPLRQFESWIVVFNIGGNKYRLIAAVHYNTQIVYFYCNRSPRFKHRFWRWVAAGALVPGVDSGFFVAE